MRVTRARRRDSAQIGLLATSGLEEKFEIHGGELRRSPVCIAWRARSVEMLPRAQEVREASKAMMEAFLREVVPGSSRAARALVGDLLETTLGAVGKQFSERPRTSAEIATYSDALADMMCAYLDSLSRGAASEAGRPQRRRVAKRGRG